MITRNSDGYIIIKERKCKQDVFDIDIPKKRKKTKNMNFGMCSAFGSPIVDSTMPIIRDDFPDPMTDPRFISDVLINAIVPRNPAAIIPWNDVAKIGMAILLNIINKK
jgi:hypothetical protein